MNISILTLPLHTNYGGLLQAFALQSFLSDMGHDVWHINRQFKKESWCIKYLSILKRGFLHFILNKDIPVRVWASKKEEEYIESEMIRFIKENIKHTECIISNKDFTRLKKYNFDAYFIGSDQVWRPEYTPSIGNYFLDFIAHAEKKVKRIAYAASFGVSHWLLDEVETNKMKELSGLFDFISVRETDGIDLCRKYLDKEAILMPDPTLLISKETYINMVEKDNVPTSPGNLMYYMLDNEPAKYNCIQMVADELKLHPFTIYPLSKFSESGKKDLELCRYPSVTSWLRGFMDAKYVITDSFHGTVFAILFNKPFLSIGNPERGLSRFVSLLDFLGLKERLILEPELLTIDIINKPINYDSVNKILSSERMRVKSTINNILNK